MNITELDSYRLADAVKFHNRLNPKIWGDDEHLRPEVRSKLMEIAADFQEFLGIRDLDVQDITLSGSNAAYSYTPHSDIDLHLVVNVPQDEVYQELFNAKKYQYNDIHNIKIRGADVELYVQPADEPAVSLGEYSVLRNEWIEVPKRKRANIDQTLVRHKYEDLKARIESALKEDDSDRVQALITKIKAMRQSGLDQHGEFGPENLAFKMLRTQGLIKKLYDHVARTKDRELSLRERTPVRYGFAAEDAGETWDGVNPTTCMFLNEEDDDEKVVHEFIQWAADKLGIETMPEIFIHTDPDWSVKEHSFGRYEPDTHSLHVNMANRHLFDILRTTAHELAHCRQNELRPLPDEAGATGSKWENEAHAVAGIIMRDFADAHPELFATPPLSEGKLSRTVAAAAIALAASLVHAQPSQQPNSTLGALNTALKIYGLSKITAPGVREELTQELKNYIRAQGGDAGAQNQSWVWQQQQQQLQPQQDNQPVRENASGYIPTKKQAKDPRYAMALTVDIKPGEVGRQANKMGLKTDSQGKPGLLMKTVNLRESRNDGNEPLGPEFRPTMPKGTVRVDVSDMYDWYKLGRDFANLDRANPANYGKGPPSTIVSFGDEDTEHKYIKSLQKLGLKTTDIDPADPNQPAGIPRQSTDPTYNVDESAGNPLVDLTPNYPNYRKLIGEFIGLNKNQRALFKIIDIELIPGQGPTEKIEQAKLTGRPISIEMQRIRNRKVVDQGMTEGQVYDFRPNQLIDVFYDPSTVTNRATSQKVATIPYRNLDRLTALLKQKHGIDATKLRWSAAKPNNPQDIAESGVAEDDLVESLRREFELLENEVLGEIKMSPKNLRAEAAKTGAVAGMEFEMIVPEMAGFDDDRDSEPDWDMDESVRDIDDACNFFYDGDFNSRRDIQNLREEMTEQYEEWYDERKKERWEDESADYIRDWLWRTYEDDWSEEAQQEILADTPEFGVNDDELRQRIEDFLKEKWEAATEDVLANMGSDWDAAYDEWSEDFNDNNDLEDEWLSDQGWTTMRDIYQNFDIQWPHYYTPDPEGNDINAVADDFSDAVGMPVNASTSYHGGRREPGHYVVEPDSSLEPENANEAGLEFVSPPMPIDKLMDQLKKVKAWAGRYGCYTNESTGLHINISVPDYDLAKLDYVKLALLMGDEYVLDQFGRSSNTYTKSAMGKIKNILRDNPEKGQAVLDKMKGHMADLATKAIHSGSTDKYTSINTKNGYIEFRSPGGDWLDANFDKVENTLLRFTVALSAAMDPAAYRQEYLKKLYKLLSPKGEDDPIAYFAQYSAGELPKAALRSFVKQVQLQRRIKRDPTGGQKYWWLVERPGYGASVEVVASSREEAIALGKKEYPEWDYSKDMTAKPLRPYDDSPVKATLGEPQPAGGMRPTNPDGNYVIFANNTRAGDPPAYRFMAADGDDAGIVLRQYSRVNPGDWEVHYDPNQRLGQPPVPGSTLDLQRRRAAAATSDIINPLYQNVPIPGVTDVELDIPMAEPRPLGVGRELVGWKILLPSGEEVAQFHGIGNSQADANRIAADYLRQQGMGVSGEGFEVVPVWREA